MLVTYRQRGRNHTPRKTPEVVLNVYGPLSNGLDRAFDCKPLGMDDFPALADGTIHFKQMFHINQDL